jgi:two-component system response regulator YesN
MVGFVHSVILIDDEEIIVEGLKVTVPWSSFKCRVVATATDGREGLKLIRQHKPDILFTDIRMPYLNGLEMLKEFIGEFPQTQIIILSGYRDFSYAQAAIQLGVLRFLTKPSKMNDIYEALNTAILKLSGIPFQGSPADEDKKSNPDNTSESNFVVSRAMKYINEHYSEKLTLQQLADYLYISTWYLCRVFKKNTNQNFIDILNSIRIEHAKQFLKDTNLKIYEICEKTGYSDIAYFSKVFHAMTGLSPKQYREKDKAL